MDSRRLLELAIAGLEAQRDRIEEELTLLRRQTGGVQARQPKPAKSGKKRGRKRTPAEKRAHSERMKAIWAAKKKANR